MACAACASPGGLPLHDRSHRPVWAVLLSPWLIWPVRPFFLLHVAREALLHPRRASPRLRGLMRDTHDLNSFIQQARDFISPQEQTPLHIMAVF
eukprot:Gb_38577 [translate_table: standard]